MLWMHKFNFPWMSSRLSEWIEFVCFKDKYLLIFMPRTDKKFKTTSLKLPVNFVEVPDKQEIN